MQAKRIAFTTVQSTAHNLQGHPENPNRFRHFKSLDDLPTSAIISYVEPKPADEEIILKIHPAPYLEALQQATQIGPGFLDYGDTYVTSASYEAALMAAGGVLEVLGLILKGEVEAGYALVRPPGHHATHTKAMGFCLLNNIAIAAKVAH